MADADVLIIGGGIVGLATAYQLALRHPDRRAMVLEKEPGIARHQTGRNSGVIHSGIYYKPGSLKATTCRAGKVMLEQFCRREDIPFEICGKIIVATEPGELPRLDRLLERGRLNGVRCERIGPDRARALEPHVSCIDAIHVAETGIVDYPRFCERLAELVRNAGGEVVTGSEARSIERAGAEIVVRTDSAEYTAGAVVNCAGLQSDRVTAMSGGRSPVRIVPFRGEYYELRDNARGLCHHLIYPTPDPAFPFLGVHFTRMIGGGVECGPNAVLALAREGYTWDDADPRDLFEVLLSPAFWSLAGRHWKTGLGEIHRSLSKAAFVRALQRLIPEIREEHLEPAPSGVRAQALAPDGRLVDDFSIEARAGMVNVCNAPSPAATSSLAIGDGIVDLLGFGRGTTRSQA